MKNILNPKWQKEKFIEIDEFTSEEESQSKKVKGMISKALENIEESIKSIPDIVVDKRKRMMLASSKETIKEPLHVEEIIEDIQNCKVPGEENMVLSSNHKGKRIVNLECENEQ